MGWTQWGESLCSAPAGVIPRCVYFAAWGIRLSFKVWAFRTWGSWDLGSFFLPCSSPPFPLSFLLFLSPFLPLRACRVIKLHFIYYHKLLRSGKNMSCSTSSRAVQLSSSYDHFFIYFSASQNLLLLWQKNGPSQEKRPTLTVWILCTWSGGWQMFTAYLLCCRHSPLSGCDAYKRDLMSAVLSLPFRWNRY